MMFTFPVCVTIVIIYLLLNNEDYRWPWPWMAFNAASSTGLYVLYSVYYFIAKTEMSGILQTWFLSLLRISDSGSYYFGVVLMLCVVALLVSGEHRNLLSKFMRIRWNKRKRRIQNELFNSLSCQLGTTNLIPTIYKQQLRFRFKSRNLDC